METKVTVEFKDHDKIVLTRLNGDTYTSKSEELIDFFRKVDKEQDNWITVKDRLPESATDVLVSDIESDIVSTGYYINDNKDWVVNTIGVDVTHWQPLPNPPKS